MSGTIGCDPSLNSTGVAVGAGPTAETFLIEGRGDEPREYRLERLRRGLGATARRLSPDTAVIETPSYGSPSARELAGGVQWVARLGLCQPSVDVLLLVAPSQLKVWLADDGHATKNAMAAALLGRTGLRLGQEDLVDAWALWSLGQYVRGREFGLRDVSVKAERVAWSVWDRRVEWR